MIAGESGDSRVGVGVGVALLTEVVSEDVLFVTCVTIVVEVFALVVSAVVFAN